MTSSPAALKPLVLVVEDEDAHRRMLDEMLALLQYRTSLVGSLTEAQNALRQRGGEIDAVLLDLMLGQEPGEDLFDAIQACAPRAAVIVISGLRNEEVVVRCLARGAVDFLQKPFCAETLEESLARALRQRKNPCPAVSDGLRAENPTTGWVELTAPSDFEFLTRMQRFSQILFGTRLPRDTAEDLRMIMEEMGRNAIEWGNRFDRQKQFHISYCFFRDRVVLKFEDEGEGFDPKGLPDPSEDPADHLMKREKEGKRPGGFGVFLVQRIMDEVVYNERGNVVIMTKYLDA